MRRLVKLPIGGVTKVIDLGPGSKVRTRDARQEPFASDSIWNTALGTGAIFESSTDTKTANLLTGASGAYINAGFYSVPINIATPDDHVATVTWPNGGTSTHRIPAAVEIAIGTDGSSTIIDGDTAHDYYQMVKVSNTAYTAQYGTSYSLLGSGVGSGLRASRFGAIGGMIRQGELTNIPHALIVALSPAQLKSGWVWPATLEDEDANNLSDPEHYTGQIPMGTLIGIPGTVDLTTLGLSTEGLACARAFQDYGGYVGDRGAANWVLWAEPDLETTPGLARMRADLDDIIWPLLRVVTNSTSSTVGGGGTRRQPTKPAPSVP